jgi:Cys-tRNA(Pro) deacylase
MRTSNDLQQFIAQHHIEASILHLSEDTPTVPDAARVLNVAEAQIIKSLVFLVRGEPVLIIANGSQKIDQRKLAARFEVGRKRVKLASAEQALEITGFVVGAMPPFGHKTPLSTYVDPQVTTLPLIYGGGGDIHVMLKLTPDQLLEVTQAEVLSLVAETD